MPASTTVMQLLRSRLGKRCLEERKVFGINMKSWSSSPSYVAKTGAQSAYRGLCEWTYVSVALEICSARHMLYKLQASFPIAAQI